MPKKPYGVLILHGFPDNLDCVRPVESPLNVLGLSIRMPLLRGHGAVSPEALRGVTWHDWLADAESALMDLLTESDKAIIVGYSMGGALTCLLAADHAESIDSIVLTAAAVHLTSPLAPGRPFNFLVPLVPLIFKEWDFPPDPMGHYQGSYPWVPIGSVISFLDLSKAAHACLPKIQTPALILQSRKDDVVAPESMNIIYNGISTPTEFKRMVWFDKTGHDMFHDCEHDAVIEEIIKYILERISQT